ncbi:WD40-repeat-containing domain protein [Multifurca ochricompacta]|uniref:WD40-repeat-containing domain protein n=1 Tax=Multifurca ochricompacta TaxID=376703 RepID=A0AAD4MD18_9AGAM|nr:WD40-repeat-containing domain protein [Multifurca ochricompacta]
MAAASSSTQTPPSIPVVFSTKTQYQLPPQKFMVPASWRRFQLSQLINTALALPRVVPFDFLIRGVLLRGTLSEAANGEWKQEETLEIEYIESVMPPTRLAALPHEEWVSSISCSVPGQSLPHELIRWYIPHIDRAQTLLHTAPWHPAPITSFTIVSSNKASSEQDVLVVTASHDRTAQISRASLNGTETTSTPLATLHLHDAPIADVASNQSGNRILTAGWDGLIGLWSSSIPEIDEVPLEAIAAPERKKRRKVQEDGSVKTKAPSAVLRSHTARVSAVKFSSADDAVSCGFDSTIRTWDVERGLCSHTITVSEKPFLALALPAVPATALAASADRSATLFDLRTGTSVAAAVKFTHPATPAALVFAQNSESQFASGAYDGVVRIWDVRSATHEVANARVWDGQKVLGLDWAGKSWPSPAKVESKYGVPVQM